jgi:hypothetical protein
VYSVVQISRNTSTTTTHTRKNKLLKFAEQAPANDTASKGGDVEWEQQVFAYHSFRAAVSEHGTSCDKTGSATILLQAIR